MKKVIAITLAVLLLLAVLAGCGGNKYTGTYVVTKLADWTIEEYADIFGESVETVQDMFKMELKSNGKCAFSFGEEPEEVDYKIDGNKITLSADGETMEGTINGKEITLDFEGEVVVFTKK